MTTPRSIPDVVGGHLCSGCGACSYLAPDAFRMADTTRGERRPLPLVPVSRSGPAGSSSARDAVLSACPGAGVAHETPLPDGHLKELGAEWGPVLEVWEGYAGDPEIRYAGSSGGAATALGLHCIERMGMHGVLHTKARDDVPYLNETTLSTTRSALLDAAGSRYAPASPCDGLGLVEAAPAPSVFIGKPCDVYAAARAAELRAGLRARLGLTIAVFCAGTPTTAGTIEAMRSLGVEPTDAVAVRYRGRGWPGRFGVRTADGNEKTLSYEESWGDILQRHRQWRCMICADHTGEFADVSVGDPWYRPIAPGDPGRSLILVRTESGRRVVRSAIDSGALVAVPTSADILPASQPNLLATRGAVWGRLLTMRVMGMPTTRYRRLPMFRAWLRLPARDKLRSTGGTVKRIQQRHLRRRVTPKAAPERRGAATSAAASPLRHPRD